MQPFLEKLAGQLFTQYGENIHRLCIIFPNRRAGLFMKQYLSRLISKPVWMPDIYALEDFIKIKSKIIIPDQLELLVKLFRVYQSIEGLKAKPFAEFISWGTILLSDFDEIDQYLVDGERVFSYLDEIKAMKEWNPDGSPLTEFEKNYLQFYNSLSTLYIEFRKSLLKDGEGYFGLAFRHLIDKLDEQSFADWDKVIIAGFNALTTAEEQLFSTMVAEDIAEIYWDADEYYLSDSKQEAGYFLRNYVQDRRFGEMKWIERSFRNGEKNISIIGVPGNIGQAKLAGQLTEELVKQVNPSDVAIVLVDEGIMLPVLNSIPSTLENFNVTMGYPMKLTPVYTLFDAIFKLFLNARKYARVKSDPSGKERVYCRFYHKDINRFFSHPYIAAIQSAPDEIPERNVPRLHLSFYKPEDFHRLMKQCNPTLSELFSNILITEQVLPNHLTILLIDLVDFYRMYFQKLETENINSRIIDLEYLYQFSQLLGKIRLIANDSDILTELETFYEVFSSLVSGMRLPFYGEPLKGLQLMGMLETRSLDFENIIMLSANEGQLPKGKHQNTFLPDEVRKQFNLQRYSEHDAVFGYHFYRLLQRAERVFLLYNTEGDSLGGGEKSRFITQIKYELPLYNSNIRIEEKILSIPPPGIMESPVLILKDFKIQDRLIKMASLGFSPTAISRYVSCSLQFCFSDVMRISEADQVEESIDAATLGEVVHMVLHNNYLPFVGKKVTPADVGNMLQQAEVEVRKVFNKEFPGTDLDTGKNLLIVKVAENMIRRFLQTEKDFIEKNAQRNQGIEILKLEEWLETTIDAPDSKTGEIFKVLFKGKVDRIDRFDGRTRIIDYKTGQVTNTDIKIDDVAQLLEHKTPAKIIQLLSYALMYQRMNPCSPGNVDELVSGIISMRFSSRYHILATIGKEEVLSDELLTQFEAIISEILSEIFNPEIPFMQTGNRDTCALCSFQLMCNRVIN